MDCVVYDGDAHAPEAVVQPTLTFDETGGGHMIYETIRQAFQKSSDEQ